MSASVCQWVWLHVAKPWDYIRLTYYTWPDDLRCGIDRRDCHDQPDAPMVWYVVSRLGGVRRHRIPHDVATALKWCDYDTVRAIRDAARDELLSRLW